jgi:hypothetical protein
MDGIAASARSALTSAKLLRLGPDDHVAVVVRRFADGEEMLIDGVRLSAPCDLGLGHKIAVRPVAAGQRIMKYGAPIGRATRDITVGEHVHVHNLASDYTPTYVLEEAGRP